MDVRSILNSSVRRLAIVATLLPGGLAGCIGAQSNPAATQPSTAIDPATITPDYWLAKPAGAAVVYDNFDKLFGAIQRAAYRFSYVPDRVDLRGGLVTTFPEISKQWLEPWRHDVVTAQGLNESSLATIRRTIRFEVRRLKDGRYACVPKVLVERYVQFEHRITSVTQYNDIFSIGPADKRREAELNPGVPVAYWNAFSRDEPLERALVESIANDLKSKPDGTPTIITGAQAKNLRSQIVVGEEPF